MADDNDNAGSGGKTVTLPAIGTVKKTYVWVAVALVAGIVGYAYWARARAGSDELTADELPMAEIPAGTSTTPGLSQNYDNDPPNPDDLPPTTNDEWSRRAVAYLRDELYYDPATAAAALGKFLARLPLVPAEQDIVRTAIGVLGKPPQGDYSVIPVPNPPNPSAPPVITPPPPTPRPTGNEPYLNATVKAGWLVDQWQNDVRRSPGGNPNLNWGLLEQWNPGIWNDITHETNTAARKFKVAKTYRINWTGKGGSL